MADYNFGSGYDLNGDYTKVGNNSYDFTTKKSESNTSMYLYGASSAYQVYNGLNQASLIRNQGALTEKISEINANSTELDAYETLRFGDEQAARYETQVQKVIGAQRVSNAANNVDSNFGTAKTLMNESRLNGMLNAIDIQTQARNRSLGLQQQARMIRLQGSFARMQADTNAAATRNASYAGALQTAAIVSTRR